MAMSDLPQPQASARESGGNRSQHAADTQCAVHHAHEVLAEAEIEQEEIVVQEKDEQREIEERGGSQKEPELPSEAVHAPPETQRRRARLRQRDRVMPQPPRGVREIPGPDARAAVPAARRQIARQQAPPRDAPRIRARIEQADVQPEVILIGMKLLRGGGEREGLEPRRRSRAGARSAAAASGSRTIRSRKRNTTASSRRSSGECSARHSVQNASSSARAWRIRAIS